MSDPDLVEVLPEGLGPPPSTSRLGVGVVATLLAAAGVGGLLWGRERLAVARVGVEEAWLSVGLESERIERVERVRAGTGDLYYHARLTGAPLGRTLEIECEWFDPTGVTVRHNRYETRVLDHDPWPTHCACPMSDAVPGDWRVLMSLEGRGLSETLFEVEAP